MLLSSSQIEGGGGGAPGITSLTGTIADGQEVTIQGYGFTDKTNAKPMFFWDADGGSLNSSSLSRKSFALSHSMITGVKAANSSHSMEYSYPTYPTIGDGAIEGPFDFSVDGDGDEFFIFMKRRQNWDGLDAYADWQRLNSGGSAWNHKYLRAYADTGNDLLINSVGGVNTAQGSPRLSPENTDGTTYVGNLADLGADAKDKWITELHRVRQSSAVDAADGEVESITNGRKILTTGIITRDSGNTGLYKNLYWPQAQFIYQDTGYKHYFDCFYLDDTPHTIVITDRATWNPTYGDVIELWIPKTWTKDGNGLYTVTAEVRQGDHSTLSGKYAYILTADGSPVSTTGYLI